VGGSIVTDKQEQAVLAVVRLIGDQDVEVTMADREVCAALIHALGLESDLLASRPELLWQQLANRLRWEASPALATLVDREEARRTSADDPPWLQLQRPVAPTPGLLHTLRTRGRAQSCALSPDGALLAGGADDGAALWDALDGAWLADLPGHHGPVHACVFSADGRALYTGDESGTLRRWTWDGVRARLETSRQICHGPVRACAASIDHVVIAAADGLHLCTGGGLEVLARLDESDAVRCCAVDDRGDLVVAGYLDGGIRTWRRDGDRVVPAARRRGAHEGAVYGCTVDGAGTTVFTAGQKGGLRRWDSGLLPLGDPLVDRALSMPTGVWGCAGSSTLDRAAAALVGGAVQVWDVPGGTATLLAGHAGIVNAVAMSRDGSRVASAGYDETVRLWDPAAAATASAEPFSAMIQALAISADGRRVLTVDAYGIARLGSTSAPAGETVFTTCQTWCMDGAATADLRSLIVVDQAGTLEVWDVHDEPRLRHRLPHDNAAACVLIGHRLAVSAGDDGTCHGWDIVHGDRLWTTALGRGAPVLTVGNDRPTVLAASGSGVVRLLDPHTGQGRTLRDSGDPVLSGALGPDGAVAVGTDHGDVLRWQAEGAIAPRRRNGGHDGRVLHIAPGIPRFPFLSASADGELALWPADATEAPRRWSGHDGPSRRVAVSAADELAVSTGDDKTLRIWTLTGEQRALLPISGNGQMLALHSTSQLIACGDDGGFVYLGRLRHS
jgi:WD40 repeat protein